MFDLELAKAVSAENEYRARSAIRQLLEEHAVPWEPDSYLAVQLKLSLWLEEEYNILWERNPRK
jgi:hypothetical protein